MWYFSWVLGVSFACTFGILNAMWFAFNNKEKLIKVPTKTNK